MSEKKIQVFVHTQLSTRNKDFLRNALPSEARVVFLDDLDPDSAFREFAVSNYVYGNPPAAWLHTEDSLLEWVQLYSAGFNEYQGLGRPLPISNLHGFFAQPCAETVLAGILGLFRRIDELTLLKSRRDWRGHALRPSLRLLHAKRVVLLGTGTIAMAIRQLLTGFQCPVRFFGRTHPEAEFRTMNQVKSALPDTDILINTLPGTEETRGLVDASVLEAMPPHAVFVNIGRGSTVDEPALIRVLKQGGFSGAVLDVSAEEPLTPRNPLWDLPQVILTQHTGGGWEDEEREKVRFFLRNLDRVLGGKSPLNLVNLPKGY